MLTNHSILTSGILKRLAKLVVMLGLAVGKHDPALSWERMKREFPNVAYVVIANQNCAGGKQGLCSPLEHWEWLKNSSNPDLQCLYRRNRTAKVNEGKLLGSWVNDVASRARCSRSSRRFARLWSLDGID